MSAAKGKKLEESRHVSQEPASPDPLLLRSEYGTVLVLGRSGTGKSTLIRTMLKLNYKTNKKKNRSFVTVNARDSEYSTEKHIGQQVKKDLSKLTTSGVKNSIVIIEDIISMSTKEEKTVRQILNYDAHHKRLKVFAIAHHVYKTSLFSMLPFFHYIIFTSSPSNLPLLKFCLNYFKIDSDQSAEWTTLFRNTQKSLSTCFVFDCQKVSLFVGHTIEQLTGEDKLTLVGSAGEEYQGSSQQSAQEKITILQDKFEKFMIGQVNRHEASAVFSIIVRCLPLTNLREHDLTIAFRHKNPSTLKSPGSSGRVSIVDYITTLLKPKKSVTSEILFLHRYLKGICCIPEVFVKNKQLDGRN